MRTTPTSQRQRVRRAARRWDVAALAGACALTIWMLLAFAAA